ncbi:Superoxide dismutase [Bacillus thuringiensis serovar israelensis ATCC 35646]|nr:Superoxide dismutase [Bacillus thuringiensis serovar israelensis ATCC 35646]
MTSIENECIFDSGKVFLPRPTFE